MRYLYHIVPKEMHGHVLKPLSELKQPYPELFKKLVERYKGRRYLLTRKLRKLNCRWNDVIHLSAVNPCKINEALLKEGAYDPYFIKKCYQINPFLLDRSKTIVFWYRTFNRFLYRFVFRYINDNETDWFDPKEVKKYDYIPERTKATFKELIKKNKRVLVFEYVPHIFFKGDIDVNDKRNVTEMRIERKGSKFVLIPV